MSREYLDAMQQKLQQSPYLQSANERSQQYLQSAQSYPNQPLQNGGLSGHTTAYPNSLSQYARPSPILVHLDDATVERIIRGVLDGMQERWGRKYPERGGEPGGGEDAPL